MIVGSSNAGSGKAHCHIPTERTLLQGRELVSTAPSLTGPGTSGQGKQDPGLSRIGEHLGYEESD